MREEDFDLIENWDWQDVLGLIVFISERWCWSKDMCTTRWDLSDNLPVLHWELHTGGWSDNEAIARAVEKNVVVTNIFKMMWKRGGHFYYQIPANALGYKLVSEYCKENEVSRQSVHKSPNKFDWIKISPNKQLIKRKKI